MFGESIYSEIGLDPWLAFSATDSGLLAFFFFRMVFCGTATTIVLEAVAGRMRFSAHCVPAVVIFAVICPAEGKPFRFRDPWDCS